MVSGWKELKIVISVADSVETLTLNATKIEVETNHPSDGKAYWTGFNPGSTTYAKIVISTTGAKLDACMWYGNDVTSTTRVYYFIRK